jgi:hypothetical protein
VSLIFATSMAKDAKLRLCELAEFDIGQKLTSSSRAKLVRSVDKVADLKLNSGGDRQNVLPCSDACGLLRLKQTRVEAEEKVREIRRCGTRPLIFSRCPPTREPACGSLPKICRGESVQTRLESDDCSFSEGKIQSFARVSPQETS